MTTARSLPLSALYERDETAWLEVTADLIRQGQLEDVDYPNLAEYLTDMARRDRREVESRLATLLAHLLKWSHQAGHRSGSWKSTIVEQRQELASLVSRGVLRNHAEAALSDAYRKAIERAVAETDLPAQTFPEACPFTLDELLSVSLLAD